jgi:hypothetical protein
MGMLPAVTKRLAKELFPGMPIPEARMRVNQLCMNCFMDRLYAVCKEAGYVLCADGLYRLGQYFVDYYILDGMEVMGQTGCGKDACVQCDARFDDLAKAERYV